MKILIKNLQQIIKINPQPLKKLIKKICYLLGINKGVISFVFTDNKNIRVLNKEYFKRDYPTDVISFDLRDEFDFLNILGEIIISVEKALENSQIFFTPLEKDSDFNRRPLPIKADRDLKSPSKHTTRPVRYLPRKKPKVLRGLLSNGVKGRSSLTGFTDFKKELLLYIIHGLLHLLGFEDKTFLGKKKMRKKEKDLLFFIDKKEKKLISFLTS